MGTAPGLAVRERTGPKTDPVRVLVVDDSPTVRAVFARLIGEELDLEVASAEESAERALATLLQTAPDVILLDLDMPGMGGLDAIPRMLELAAPARILVVSSLTVRGAEHTLAALSLGAADTMAKPQPGKFDKEYRATLMRKIRLLGRVAKRARVKSAFPEQPLRPQGKGPPHILAIGASRKLLTQAGVPIAMDKSQAQGGTGLIVVDTGAAQAGMRAFLQGLAKHRHFGRETDPPLV